MDATRIIAIRHGETAWNVDSRLQGHLDIPLNDVGLWQARQAALALADEPIDAIYSSDLQRAWVTARAIAETTQAPLAAHQGLRERSFGVLQGHTFEELEAKEPEQAYRWRKRDPAFAPEGGESLIALRERITATTHALCPGLLQQQGQLGAFVHLGVGPPAHLVLAGEVGHALDVAVHGVQVHHQGGGVDQVYPLADEGGEGVRRGFHRVRRCPGAVCRPSPPG